MTTMEQLWSDVEVATRFAKCIAWDGCHKCYLAMDDHEADWFATNYEHVVRDESPETYLATLQRWWNESCGLRFVQAVSHDEDDPNAGFVSLIPQFADAEDEDTCDNCGESECYGGECYEDDEDFPTEPEDDRDLWS